MVETIFCNYLDREGVADDLKSVLCSIKDAAKQISKIVKTADIGRAGTKNVYGEEQLALDVLSDKIIQNELKKNDKIGLLASEELPEEMKISDGSKAVAYDPLDGSSLVDVNLSVGTIFSVYETDTFLGKKGDDMEACGFVVYGPRTTLILTVRKGVVEFTLGADDKFYLTKENLQVGPGKMFAPGNLRACSSCDDYIKLMEFWMKEEYTLRYSGGMVPDINQILLKGKGIFTYPGYVKQPDGKLRLLFECAPISLLLEQAGGAGTDGKMRILDKEIRFLEQRTPIFVGSKEEVKRAEEYLMKKY